MKYLEIMFEMSCCNCPVAYTCCGTGVYFVGVLVFLCCCAHQRDNGAAVFFTNRAHDNGQLGCNTCNVRILGRDELFSKSEC
jgi:hypothetical protein